jgi:hypothetical protein
MKERPPVSLLKVGLTHWTKEAKEQRQRAEGLNIVWRSDYGTLQDQGPLGRGWGQGGEMTQALYAI